MYHPEMLSGTQPLAAPRPGSGGIQYDNYPLHSIPRLYAGCHELFRKYYIKEIFFPSILLFGIFIIIDYFGSLNFPVLAETFIRNFQKIINHVV